MPLRVTCARARGAEKVTQWREPPVLLVLRCGLLHANLAERLRHRATALRETAVELPPGPKRDRLLEESLRCARAASAHHGAARDLGVADGSTVRWPLRRSA